MAVAADAVRLLAHDQARLAVRLVADQAVDDVRAHLLQRARPADVGLLVEARLQLDEHRDLLAVLGRGGERLRDRRGRAHAVERHLDGEHRGIDRRLLHEAGDGVERLVRVVDEDVALRGSRSRRRRAPRRPAPGAAASGRSLSRGRSTAA